MTRQVGNEIDEFVTDALRNNLLGLPLDLAALNIARGRDTGMPSLNEARAQFYEMTGDTQLKPYDSWVDFARTSRTRRRSSTSSRPTARMPASPRKPRVEAKRDAATLLVFGRHQTSTATSTIE